MPAHEPAVGSGGGVGATPSIDWFALLSSVAGGLALMSFSLSRISSALRLALGGGLRDAIQHATRTRARAFMTGAIATALLSSATASSLLVIGFVQSGDMSLDASLGIGLGIGVGATLNAHLLAFSPHRYAMAAVALGHALLGWGANSGGAPGARERAAFAAVLGDALLGLGLLFASAAIVSGALAPLRGYGPFLAFLGHMHRPELAMTVSALIAIAFQSANTVVAVAVSLAQQGLLSSELGVYFVIGANVGTSVTPILSAMGQRAEALRVAVAFFALKLLGVTLLLPLLSRFVSAVQWSTLGAQTAAEEGAYDAMVDLGRTSADASLDVHRALETLGRRAVLPMQVANAHTMLNVWCAVVTLPLLSHVARAVQWALPDHGPPLPTALAAADKLRRGRKGSAGSIASDAAEGKGEGAGAGSGSASSSSSSGPLVKEEQAAVSPNFGGGPLVGEVKPHGRRR